MPFRRREETNSFQTFMMGKTGERLLAKTICSSRAEQLEQDLLFALFGTV